MIFYALKHCSLHILLSFPNGFGNGDKGKIYGHFNSHRRTYCLFFSLPFPFSMYFTSTIIVKYDKICPNKPRIVLSSICCLLPVFDSCDCETMDSSLCVNSHFPFSIKCSRFIYDNILHALCARRLFLSR